MSARPTSPVTPSGGLSRVPYLPGLDGLRAIAVIGVMLYHANHNWLPGGYLGVEVFFVISGYLITLLLLGEHERTGTVRLRQFWLRRARRLLPALFVMMAALAVYIAAFMPVQRDATRGDFVAGLFYVSNWFQIVAGQGYGSGADFAPLRHLWSLAVEEQFYLLWPLIMLFVLRRNRKRLPQVGVRFVGISLLITAIMAILYRPGTVPACGGEYKNGLWTIAGRCINVNQMLYLGSVTRAGGLLLGAGFAMLWRPVAILRSPLRDKGRRLDIIAVVSLLALLLMMRVVYFLETEYNPVLFRGGFFVAGVATLAIIAAATHQRAATGSLLGNPVLLWIGTRSYGLYLFHWPIFEIYRKAANVLLTPAEFVLLMAITGVVTECSYRFIEMPVRKGRLGELLAAVRRTPAQVIAGVAVVALVLLAATSFLVAGSPSTTIADGATDTTDVPTSDPVVVPGDSSDPTVATTTTIPKVPQKYVAIGESVMEGAKPQLQAAGVFVDTKEGRGPEGVKNVVIKLRDNGDLGVGSTVIIQVGTNAPLSNAALDAIMAEMPAGVVGVFFMTLRAPNQDFLAANNQKISAVPSRYPNVQLIDWATQSRQVQLCPDGTHLLCNGLAAVKFYTNLLLAAFGLPAIT